MNLENDLRQYACFGEQELQDRRLMLQALNTCDDLLFRSNETAHFTASGWIVNPARTHVLMVYHNIYKSWSWTGGHTDGDPCLSNTALREAREETGLDGIHLLSDEIFSLEILPVIPHFRRGQFVSAHLHFNLTYLLEADDCLRPQFKPDENNDVRWFSLGEAVNASTEPAMRIVYQKLNEKLAYLKSDGRI